MNSSVVIRHTLDSDKIVFPSYQFWSDGNVVWWDLNYVHAFFRRNHLTNLKRCRWLAEVGNIIRSAMGEIVHFHKAPANSDSELVQAPIATSRGLLSYFSYFLEAMKPTNPSGQAVVLAILACLTNRAAETIGFGEQCSVLCSGNTCAVDRNAGVSGFVEMMGRLKRHPQQLQLFADVWRDLRNAHVVNGCWSDSSHNLHDILKFLCCFMRHERFNKKRHAPHTRSLIDSSRAAFMTWLGARIDMYVVGIYNANNPICNQPPPALRAQRLARQRTEVHPEAIWDIFEKAKKARTNLEQAIDLKSDEAAFIF